MRIKRCSLAAALTLALVLPASASANVFSELDEPATIESGPTISIATDKADYAPGELVTVTGSGWQPGESVALSVADDGVAEQRFQYDAVVTADANGDIVDRFNIAEWYVAEYYVTATGEFSGVATTTFTDTLADYRQGTTGVGGTPACTNPNFAVVSDDQRARCVRTTGATGQSVIVSGFGLDSVVPVGATNIQFNVEVEGLKGTANRAVRLALSHDGGTTFTTATNDTTQFTSGTSDQVKTFPTTEPTNCDNFGRTWTRSATPSLDELSDAKFRVRATTLGATSATDFVDIDRIRVRACWDGSNITQAATGGRLTGVAYPSANTTVIGQVQVNLRGSGAPAWKGTTYQFEGGSEQCVDTGNHTGSAGGVTADHFFSMTAPAARGIYDLTFRAYPNDDCSGTPLAPFTLTDAFTVGIFGDSFGRDTDGVYTENDWTDGGPDCTVERVGGIIDFDAYLQVRQGCEQQKLNISTAGLQNIHLKYRWGWETSAAVTNGLQVQWKESSSGTWQNVGTGSHNLGNSSGSPTIPNSEDFDLGDDADDTSIDIKFKGNTSADALKALVDDVVVTGDPAPQAATVTVHKDFSDDNDDAVSVDLTNCSSGTDSPAGAQSATDEDNTGGAPAEFTVSGLSSGTTCTVVESPVPAGYTATYGGDCDSEGVVTIDPGDDVDCTVTNTLNTATFTVTKAYSDSNTDAVDVQLDCTDDAFDDTGSAAPGTGNEEVFTLSGFEDEAMTCSVTETRPPGYTDSYSAGCTSVTIEIDGDYTCDITNTLNSATFTVTKSYSDSNTDAVDVQLDCSDDDYDDTGSAAPGTGNEKVFTLTGFEDGAMTCDVTETRPSGYTASYSGDCDDVTVDVDGDYTCDITNTLNTATFTVTKAYSDSNTDAVNVQLDCTGDDFDDTGSAAPGTGNEEVFTVSGFEDEAISCDVTETRPSGYTASYSGDCDDVTVEVDGDYTCDITNTLNTATFTVTKAYSDSNTDAVDVQLDCSDNDYDDTGSAAPGTGNEEVFTVSGFEDGAISCDVTETRPSGYTASYSGDCDDVTVEVDGDYTCDITNTLNTATFTVTKSYSDSNTDAVDVQLDCSDNSYDDTGSAAPGTGNEEVFTVSGFEDGAMTCSVTETRPNGYTASYDGDCKDVTVEVDGDYTCDITNTLNTATFTVTKAYSDSNTDAVNVQLDCTGDDFDDTGSAAPGTGNEEVFTVSGFEDEAISCDVTETRPSGYTASYSGNCDDVTVEVDGDYTCDITNTLNTAKFTVTKAYSDSNTDAVDVQLDCSDNTYDDTGSASPGTGNEAVFNLSGFEDGAMTCSVTETRPDGYSASYSGDCKDVTVEVDGDYTCDITNTLNTATFTVTKAYSDSNTDAVDITLDCSDDDFDDTGSAAPGTGNEAVFNLSGFEDGAMTCSVTEDVPPGYTASYDGDCDDVTVEVDGDYTCDITNTLNTATFTVTKSYSDSNTDAVEVQLDCSDDDFDDTGSAAPGTGNEAVFNLSGFEDGAMTCSVTETRPSGYKASYSGDCKDVTVDVDGDYTCDITNTLNTATFKVYKQYSPAGPGASSTMKLDCTGTALDDSKQAAPGAGNEATFNLSGFEDGVPSCSITEDPVPDGYSDSYGSGCKTVTIADDGTYNCTVTNTLNSANITVSKQYTDSNTSAVSVTLTCESGTVGGSNPRNVAPGSPQTFNVTGFNTGDSCDASESPVPAGYAQDNTDCQDVVLGTKTACTINNVTALTLVTQGGCTFDRNTTRNLRQFPLIYTPDGSASGHKLNASNPGQFFMNAAYGGSATSIQIKIPYPFVTVGTNPVKVYDGVTTTNASKTCFAPDNLVKSQTDQVTWNWNTDSFGSTPKTITVTKPANAFVYVRIHLNYGLKGVAGNCAKTGTTDPFTASCSSPAVTISGYKTYQFSFTGGAVTPTDTIESYNVFKKNPGIGGLVLQNGTTAPIGNTKVEVWQSNKKMADLYTDEDGWYMWSYKYTGKAATFNVKVPAYGLQQSVTLKSNGYLSVPFTTP